MHFEKGLIAFAKSIDPCQPAQADMAETFRCFSIFCLSKDHHIQLENQSVGYAGVAFVYGANERNEFLEKNIQTVIFDEQVQTNKAKD